MRAKFETRIAKCKKYARSPYPRTAVLTKHADKQGFPNTRGKKA